MSCAAVGFDGVVELVVGDVSEAIGAQVGGGRGGARVDIVDIPVMVLCDAPEDLEVLGVDEKDFGRASGEFCDEGVVGGFDFAEFEGNDAVVGSDMEAAELFACDRFAQEHGKCLGDSGGFLRF